MNTNNDSVTRILPTCFSGGAALAVGLVFMEVRRRAGVSPMGTTVFSILSVVLFLTLVPSFLCRWKRTKYVSDAGWQLFLMVGLTITGYAVGTLPFLQPVAWLLPLTVLGLTAYTLYTLRRSLLGLIQGGIFVVLGFLLGIWTATISFTNQMRPLSFENLLAGNIPELDTMFHMSIANMIRTYGIPSTGMNGLSFIHYHFGSHIFFGYLTDLLNTDIITAYVLFMPMLVIPLCFGAVIRLGIWIQDYFSQSNFLTILTSAILLIFFCTSFFDQSFLNSMGIWKNFYISESYAFSEFIGVCMVELALRYFSKTKSEAAAKRSDFYLWLATLSLGLFLVILAKISTGVLFVGFAGYLFFRLELFKKMDAVKTVSVLMIVTMIAGWLAQDTKASSSYYFLFFYTSYVEALHSWPTYFFFNHLGLILFAWLGVYFIRHNQSDKKPQLAQTMGIAVETLIVVGVLGLLPGILLKIQGGGSVYFLDPARSLAALACILSRPLVFTKYLRALPKPAFIPLSGLILFVALGLSINGLINYKVGIGKLRAQAINFKTLPANAMVESLRALGSRPKSERKQTFVHIPQSRQDYWQAMTGCRVIPFLTPVLTGSAALDGMPEYNCSTSFYGFEYFKWRTREPESKDILAPRACSIGQSHGVTETHSLSNNTMTWDIWKC